jgi:pimeloyl-ACP methyl ester carboxylesterase
MSNVEAVSFPNPEGLKLFGTLHRPRVSSARLPAVVLLSPGVKMRVGPGRLYVPLTDMLVALGYTVLRFDFFGLGDSEGELEERELKDVYNNIEVGRYVGDTLAALAYLRRVHGQQRFILGGLCGGAITALLAAERDPSVEALLSLGMTVTLASNAATPAKFLSSHELERARGHYLRKLTDPRAWRTFLTFKSNYGVIWRVAMRELLKKKQPVQSAPPAAPQSSDASVEQRGNANPLFPKAFMAFLRRGGKAFLLFSEKDRLYAEYQDKFALPHGEQLKPYLGQIREHLVANANHVLSLHEWQREMVDTSKQWLATLHAVRDDERAA